MFGIADELWDTELWAFEALASIAGITGFSITGTTSRTNRDDGSRFLFTRCLLQCYRRELIGNLALECCRVGQSDHESLQGAGQEILDRAVLHSASCTDLGFWSSEGLVLKTFDISLGNCYLSNFLNSWSLRCGLQGLQRIKG